MRIATLGLTASAVPGADAPLHALDSDELAQMAVTLADRRGGIVCIAPHRQAEAARRRLEVTRCALDDRLGVALHVTGLPPLAAGALASLAAVAAREAPSTAAIAGILPALEEEISSLAILRSVRRLEDPRPRLLTRLASLLPGSRFVVRANPEPLVRRARQGHPLPEPPRPAPPEGLTVLLASRPPGDAWIETALAEAYAAPVHRVDEPVDNTRWRGAALAEAAVVPADPVALARRLLQCAAALCPWCGEPAVSVPCPLCGHDRNRALQPLEAGATIPPATPALLEVIR